MLRTTTCKLPFPKFALEYAMSDAAFDGMAVGNRRIGATLTLVNELVPGERIEITGLWRGMANTPMEWYLSPIRLILDVGARVEVLSDGAVCMADPWPIENFGGPFTEAGLLPLLKDYLDDLRVLAQFLLIAADVNVSLEKSVSREHFYMLRCNGPTPFQWLPGCGLTAQ